MEVSDLKLNRRLHEHRGATEQHVSLWSNKTIKNSNHMIAKYIYEIYTL